MLTGFQLKPMPLSGIEGKQVFVAIKPNHSFTIQSTTRIAVTRITNSTRTTDKRPTTTSCM